MLNVFYLKQIIYICTKYKTKTIMRTTKETVTVNYLGFNFDLEGNYTSKESESYDYYGCAEDFEITEITLNGIDAEQLINNLNYKLDAWDELASLAIEQIIN